MLKRGVWLAFVLSMSPCAATAGAWTQPQGQGLVIVQFSGSSANQAFTGQGLGPTPRYTKYELQGLLEYGLTERFTAIFAPTLQHIDIGDPVNSKRTGFGYSEIGARYRLLQYSAWVVSAQATVRIPGVKEPSTPASVGYSGFETDLRLLIGRAYALGAMPAYFDVQLAQRYSQDNSNEFRADVTFGLYPAPRWLLLAQFFNVFSEGGGTTFSPTYEYNKFQLSGVYALSTHWAVQVGAFTTYHGRNALQENGGIFAVWYKF